jgi:RNA polymerase sigma-70 factor (ECF subfamily)
MDTLPCTLGATPTGDRPVRAVSPAADGRAVVFARLVQEQQARVARLASRLLGWSTDVDDVVQDIFMQAWQALPKYRGDAQLSTWLTRITINACRSHRRRRAAWGRFWAGGRRQPDGNLGAAPRARPESPADAETLATVRNAIAALPLRDQEVVVLSYLEDLSAPEIAAILNMTRNAVDVRLNRARARLRSRLSGWMEAP